MGIVGHNATIIVTPMPGLGNVARLSGTLKKRDSACLGRNFRKDPADRLAAFTNVFDAHTERLDLVDAGLWELTVEIHEDSTWNGMQFRGADVGRIGWSTGGRNLYDLAKPSTR